MPPGYCFQDIASTYEICVTDSRRLRIFHIGAAAALQNPKKALELFRYCPFNMSPRLLGDTLHYDSQRYLLKSEDISPSAQVVVVATLSLLTSFGLARTFKLWSIDGKWYRF